MMKVIHSILSFAVVGFSICDRQIHKDIEIDSIREREREWERYGKCAEESVNERDTQTYREKIVCHGCRQQEGKRVKAKYNHKPLE